MEFFNSNVNANTQNEEDGLGNAPIPVVQSDPSAVGFPLDTFGAGDHPDLRLAGDFYNVPESITRGVALVEPGMLDLRHPGEVDAFLPGAYELPLPSCHKDPPVSPTPYVELDEPFPEDVAPAQVSRPHCSSTSVQLNDNAGAAQAASCVYDFLRTKASASFTKVRPRKFAMKATVFHEMNRTLVSCSLKARVFASSSGLVVEFRRCSGDGLAFAHIFEQASAHLRLSFSLAPAQAPLLPTPPPVPAGDASAFLQPLVEMVSCGHAPAEAEAAAALAAVVSASTAGILAAYLDVQKTLEELCESRAVETAYPAARLASGLVTSSCEHHLASELTFAALRGATADHVDGLVRLELAEAVRAVAQKCAFSPCEAVSVNRHDLQRALEEAFARGVEETSGASLRLREALGTLEATQHLQDGVMA